MDKYFFLLILLSSETTAWELKNIPLPTNSSDSLSAKVDKLISKKGKLALNYLSSKVNFRKAKQARCGLVAFSEKKIEIIYSFQVAASDSLFEQRTFFAPVFSTKKIYRFLEKPPLPY